MDEREGTRDRLLGVVVAELRRPVALDPSVDARVLAAIREQRSATGRRRWLAGTGAAALAAGIVLALLVGPWASPAARTRQVQLRLAAPAGHVAVVGDFHDWDPAATPLRPTDNPGIWTVELRLKPGRYHYSFLLDGRRWVRDPVQPPAAESDFGAPMSVLMVS
jgi:hypothetical protein